MLTNNQFDVFLSYNSKDHAAVEMVAQRLRLEAGLHPFLDRWHVVPGRPWQEEIEAALAASSTVAVFFGPSGVSPWHNEEMRLALDNAIRGRDDYRIIPVLLPGAAETQLSGFIGRRAGVDFRPGLDEPEAFTRLVAGIRGQPPDRPEAFGLPDEPAPYCGLAPFTAAKAGLFFGRNQARRRLLARVEASRFVAVVGASGSGKSSLVMAGLAPALDEAWQTLIVRPGSRPLRALAEQAATLRPVAQRLQLADELETRFEERADGLSTAVSTWFAGRPAEDKLLLIVDQFEELFTLVTGRPDEIARQQAQFVANLVDAAQHSHGRCHVVLTIRSDFWARCLNFPALNALMETNQFLLGPMGREELREAIMKPAQLVGALFEKGLVGRLLDDMRGQEMALPLLQFCLDRLWQARRGAWLTHDAYEALGGVGGALNQFAERIYGELSPPQQQAARNLFLRMVALGAEFEGGYARRRVDRDELNLVGVTAVDLDRLINQLAHRDVRLIAVGEQSVELTHEALIANWQRLAAWLAEQQELLLVQRQVTLAAREWERNGRNRDYLYRRRQWRQATAVPGRDLNRLEAEFLRASRRWILWQRAAIVTALLMLAMVSGILVANVMRSRSAWLVVESCPLENVTTFAATAENAPTILAGTESYGVARSDDLLATCTLSVDGLPKTNPDEAIVRSVGPLALDACAPDRLFAGVEDSGVYRLDPGPGRWEPAGLGQETVLSLAAADGRLFAVTAGGVVYYSPDAGASWQPIGGTGNDLVENAYSVYAPPCNAGADVVYLGAKNGLFQTSRSHPSAWELVEAIPGVNAIVAAASGQGFYLAAYDEFTFEGRLYRWHPGQSPREIYMLEEGRAFPLAPHPTDPTVVYAALDNGRIIRVSETEQVGELGESLGLANVNTLLIGYDASQAKNRLFVGGAHLWEYRYSPDE